MEWIKVKIYSNREHLEDLQSYLIDIGINGCTIEDSKDFFDILEGKGVNWDYIDESLMVLKDIKTSVTVYLDNNEQGHGQLNLIKAAYDNIEVSKISDQDWANNWKKYFKPLEIGTTLTVKPSWEQYDNVDNRKIVVLDPGSSFGTGTHESTRLCLEQAEELIKGDEKVLDAGCGSGILGLSSLALNAKNCVFFDIEQSSMDTTLKNAEINGLASKVEVFCGNVLDNVSLYSLLVKKGPYDIIFANIVPDVINALLPFLYESASDNAFVICSGIIKERQQEVTDNMMKHGLKDIVSKELNGWVALTGRKINA